MTLGILLSTTAPRCNARAAPILHSSEQQMLSPASCCGAQKTPAPLAIVALGRPEAQRTQPKRPAPKPRGRTHRQPCSQEARLAVMGLPEPQRTEASRVATQLLLVAAINSVFMDFVIVENLTRVADQ